ncbi:hypothetical protein NQ317_003039 [Molorchus minor]|uniref:ADAMTS-like protein 1 n=1 Tax=Molorchus minor TaxID=1323400 RepID=A0ABQ9JFK0_9CUCU|nr:hypothetical protein NQ317_003039 [Molorchus minor]
MVEEGFTVSGDNGGINIVTTLGSAVVLVRRGKMPIQEAPPEKYNFMNPVMWPQWRKRFESYMSVSGQDTKSDEEKINTPSNSREHRMVAYPNDDVDFIRTASELSNMIENGEGNDNEENVVILGKGNKENIKFKWKLSSWSKCSEMCGGNGFPQTRTMYCIVTPTPRGLADNQATLELGNIPEEDVDEQQLSLFNTTQHVGDNLCDDAGLNRPKITRNCGFDSCPRWTTYDWSPCESSNCFALHRAMQWRTVKCQMLPNLTLDSSKCVRNERPLDKQECYNSKCVGKWKVGPWSECAAPCETQGVKYRILQCVWYNTKKFAGSACKDIPRPPVMKTCIGRSCSLGATQTACTRIIPYIAESEWEGVLAGEGNTNPARSVDVQRSFHVLPKCENYEYVQNIKVSRTVLSDL